MSTPLDPTTCTIQGDISRQDVIELVRLTSGKKVVEFGMGGSTLIITRVAQELHSYETDKHWYDLTSSRLQQQKDRDIITCPTYKYQVDAIPEYLPQHDVLWIDGRFELRQLWTRRFCNQQGVVILHDSRGECQDGPSVRDQLYWIIARHESVLNLDRIEFHPGDSNLVVVYYRDTPVKWYNWNVVESWGRADFNTDDLAP